MYYNLRVEPDEEGAGDELFEGVPYAQLRIDAVDWFHRAEHIRTRSARYGRQELDIEPEWATEAALDPRRLIGRGSSDTSVQVIGRSQGAPGRTLDEVGRILKVWLVPKEHPPKSGDWWGASASDANTTNRRQYMEGG